MINQNTIQWLAKNLKNGDCIGFYHRFAPAHYLIQKCTRGGFGHLGVVCNVKQYNHETTFDLIHIKSKFLSLNFFDKSPELRIDKCRVLYTIEGWKFEYKGKIWGQKLQLISCPKKITEQKNEELYQTGVELQPKATYSVLEAILSTGNESTQWRAKICDWADKRIAKKGKQAFFCSPLCYYLWKNVLGIKFRETKDKYIDTKEFLNEAKIVKSKIYQIVNE